MTKHVHETKSRKTRWRDFDKGDLVQIRGEITLGSDKQVKFAPAGIVLEYFDSNVYEPSSCSVLADGRVLHVSTRQLTMIKETSR